MTYKDIGAYGLIGNLVTTALVGRDGSVDWLCVPHLDSPAVFAAILDAQRGGHFSIRPTEEWDSVQEYVDETNVLRTRFRTRSGEIEVVDCMPASTDPPQRRDCLLRRVHARRGPVPLTIECRARPGYGARRPQWRRLDAHGQRLEDTDQPLTLLSSLPLVWQAERTQVTLAPGQTLWLELRFGTEAVPVSERDLDAALHTTCEYWRNWLKVAKIGKYPRSGFWQRQLDRSALVLKLLQFERTGAIAAAPTTSLPPIIFGNRNWDYRFAWVRDSSMTVYALSELGFTDEVESYLEWVENVERLNEAPSLQVAYQVAQIAAPQDERELPHLEGYKGSRPVRIGQYIIHQTQHDVYGEVLDTLFAASRYVGVITYAHWQHVVPLVEHVCRIWQEPDHGIWEIRGASAHYVHSKLMCWVALDRAVKIAEHYGFPGPLERWCRERAALRSDILTHGCSGPGGHFTQHYGTEAVDAALLLIPLMGFLPIDDPRVEATIASVERQLLRNGLVQRYRVDDGLPGQEPGFLICLFWYLNCLIKQGRLDEAEEHLRQVDGFSSPLGLFAEQYNHEYRELTGNYPQAYSHIGYALTVLNYLEARRPHRPPRAPRWHERLALLLRPRELNTGDSDRALGTGDHPARRIRHTMNTLRGLFYDGHEQRVDYERIRDSEYYRVFCAAAAALRDFDPSALTDDAERIAFWLNVYNAFVVHGVIELEIRESVREVPLFFSRIRYRIGVHTFSPDDIEHGILRGNRRASFQWRRQWRRGDPRRPLSVEEPDPRIHYALVCASRTCPPVATYRSDALEEQLDTAAKVFINGTTQVDTETATLRVSKIFKWYRADFCHRQAQLPDYIAGYLYDRAAARWLKANARSVQVEYAPYDWRLNR